jgi:hypothetical protein
MIFMSNLDMKATERAGRGSKLYPFGKPVFAKSWNVFAIIFAAKGKPSEVKR